MATESERNVHIPSSLWLGVEAGFGVQPGLRKTAQWSYHGFPRSFTEMQKEFRAGNLLSAWLYGALSVRKNTWNHNPGLRPNTSLGARVPPQIGLRSLDELAGDWPGIAWIDDVDYVSRFGGAEGGSYPDQHFL